MFFISIARVYIIYVRVSAHPVHGFPFFYLNLFYMNLRCRLKSLLARRPKIEFDPCAYNAFVIFFFFFSSSIQHLIISALSPIYRVFEFCHVFLTYTYVKTQLMSIGMLLKQRINRNEQNTKRF